MTGWHSWLPSSWAVKRTSTRVGCSALLPRYVCAAHARRAALRADPGAYTLLVAHGPLGARTPTLQLPARGGHATGYRFEKQRAAPTIITHDRDKHREHQDDQDIVQHRRAQQRHPYP